MNAIKNILAVLIHLLNAEAFPSIRRLDKKHTPYTCEDCHETPWIVAMDSPWRRAMKVGQFLRAHRHCPYESFESRTAKLKASWDAQDAQVRAWADAGLCERCGAPFPGVRFVDAVLPAPMKWPSDAHRR